MSPNPHYSPSQYCPCCSECIPHVLPCGKSVCQNQMPDESDSECSICDSRHSLPEEGLTAETKSLVDLKFQMLGIEKFERRCESRAICARIKMVLQKIDELKHWPKKFIDNYIEQQINLIDVMRKEENIALDKYYCQLFRELREYQHQCVESIEQALFPTDLCDQLREEVDMNEKFLDSFYLDADCLASMQKQVVESEAKVRMELKKLEQALLLNRHFEFKRDKDVKIDKREFVGGRHAFDSMIIESHLFAPLFNLCSFDDASKFKLIYRGGIEGFKNNNQANTLTIVKTNFNSAVFGGFTDAATRRDSFVFSLVNTVGKPTKFKCDDPSKEITSYLCESVSWYERDYGTTYLGEPNECLSPQSKTIDIEVFQRV